MRNKTQCASSLRASSPIWQAKQAARERANERWSCAKGKEILFPPQALTSLSCAALAWLLATTLNEELASKLSNMASKASRKRTCQWTVELCKGERNSFPAPSTHVSFLCGSCMTSSDYPKWRACSRASVPLDLSPIGLGRKLDWWPAGNREYREYFTPFSHVFFFSSEDVIYLSHRPRWITSSSIWIIFHYILIKQLLITP